MIWKPQIGDRVRVQKFRTLPAFNGTIEELLSPKRFNIRSDTDGKLWFRTLGEVTLIRAEAAE